jgi:hypothetical protein
MVPSAQGATLVGMPNDEFVAMPFDAVVAGTYKTCAPADGGWNCWGYGVLGTNASAYPDGSTQDINWQPAPVVFP